MALQKEWIFWEQTVGGKQYFSLPQSWGQKIVPDEFVNLLEGQSFQNSQTNWLHWLAYLGFRNTVYDIPWADNQRCVSSFNSQKKELTCSFFTDLPDRWEKFLPDLIEEFQIILPQIVIKVEIMAN